MSRSRLLCAAALASLSAPADRPVFAPEEGLSLTKTFELATDLELDELSLVVGGTEVSEMLGTVELGFSNTATIVVEDEFVELGEGRPEKLRRTFDTLSTLVTVSYSADMGSGEDDTAGSSELEGKTVLFEWDEDDGSWAVAFAGGEEGDTELLEGLEEDMDLRLFLPTGDVSEGDQWEVDPGELGPIVAPGGDLGFQADVDEEDLEAFEEILGDHLSELADEILEGTVVCTYAGTREEDGVEVAEIEIRIEIDSSTDLADFLMDMVDELSEDGGGPPDDFFVDRADLELSVEGEGLLLWNLESGHVQAFESSGDITVSLEVVAGAEGETAELSAEMSGVIEITVETG